MRTIRLQLTLLATLAAVAACGGGGDGGPTGPTGPDIRGTYTGSPPRGHSFSIRLGEDDPSVIGCAGAVVVTSSSGGNFGGTFRIDPCALLGVNQAISIPMSGTVEESGAVRFVVAGQEGIIQGLQEEGCEVVEAEDAFTGTVENGSFTAQIAADFTCPDGEGDPEPVDVRVTWGFDGTLTS